ncbi:MBL fold metallo-hydrolase [Dermatophilaceae bacterium Soc4.6]
MRLTHLGHACLLVEVGSTRLLIDPGTFSAGFDELTGLDAVIATHQHADHLDRDRVGGLLGANPGAVVLADPETVALLAADGITSARALVEGEQLTVGDVTLHPVGERHAVNHDGVLRCTNVGVVVRAAGEPSLYHPGDAYDGEPGDVDVLAVPVNGPWCKVSESIDFVRRVAPRVVTPIHQALLSPAGCSLYLHHILTWGGDGLELLDLGDGLAHEV